jgi:hypothetical protein
VRLIDFGIARFFKPGKSSDTMALGTPGYASPEAIGGQTDERSDIYSLCVTLHQLLTLHNPMNEMFSPPLVHSLNPAVSMQMERIVMRGMHSQREQRWQTAMELQAELALLQRVSFHPASPVVQAGGYAGTSVSPASGGRLGSGIRVAPTERAGYPATAGMPGAPLTSRPTTRLLMAARQITAGQFAAMAGGTLVLLILAAWLLTPLLDELDFNWNNVPIVALFGALAHAAYPRRGVVFLGHALFSLVLVGTVWLRAGSQGYAWPSLLLAALISGAVMEVWVYFLPRIKRGGSTDAWQREVSWLAGMAAIGAILFYWIVSLGSIGVDLVRPLAAAILGAVGWFLGDLVQQSIVHRSTGGW